MVHRLTAMAMQVARAQRCRTRSSCVVATRAEMIIHPPFDCMFLSAIIRTEQSGFGHLHPLIVLTSSWPTSTLTGTSEAAVSN